MRRALIAWMRYHIPSPMIVRPRYGSSYVLARGVVNVSLQSHPRCKSLRNRSGVRWSPYSRLIAMTAIPTLSPPRHPRLAMTYHMPRLIATHLSRLGFFCHKEHRTISLLVLLPSLLILSTMLSIISILPLLALFVASPVSAQRYCRNRYGKSSFFHQYGC